MLNQINGKLDKTRTICSLTKEDTLVNFPLEICGREVPKVSQKASAWPARSSLRWNHASVPGTRGSRLYLVAMDMDLSWILPGFICRFGSIPGCVSLFGTWNTSFTKSHKVVMSRHMFHVKACS